MNSPATLVPTITRQPQAPQSHISRGQPLQLWCSVLCAHPVTFWWHKGGQPLPQPDTCTAANHITMSRSDGDIHSSSLLFTAGEMDPSVLKFLCVIECSGTFLTSEEVTVSLINVSTPGVVYTAHRKWALLIGNTRYSGRPLNTTIPDCQRLATVLKRYNYRCLLLADLSLSHFRNAVNFFASNITQGDYVVFYYGGHGYHEAGDKIIPVDAKVGEKGLSEGSSCLSPVWIRNILLQSVPALLFLVLDMCRTTLPQTPKPTSTVLPDAARSCVVLHATSVHCAALEAPSSTSVLMRHLLRRVQSHGDQPLTVLGASVLQDICGESARVRTQQYPLLEADLALPRTLADAAVAHSG